MKRGISLIEILIVLAIIGLVSVLAYPAMVSTMAEQRLHRRANEIVQAMQFARFQAVFRGRPYIVRPAPVQNRPGGTLRIFEGMTPWACGNLGPEKTKPSDVAGIEGDGPYVALDTEEIGGDVGLIRVAAPGDVCFKPDGRAYDANGMPLTMPAALRGGGGGWARGPGKGEAGAPHAPGEGVHQHGHDRAGGLTDRCDEASR